MSYLDALSKFLLLDEPTSGMSTGEKRKVMDAVSSAAREKNVTALISEHDVDIVFGYSDGIVAMHLGRVQGLNRR